MSAIKLEACPFCGEHLEEIAEGYFQHSNKGCFFDAYEFDFCASPSMILEWNRRAQPAEEVQKMREALEQIYRGRYCSRTADRLSDTHMADIAGAAISAKDAT